VTEPFFRPADLEDPTLSKLNRKWKELTEQVGRVQGLAGYFTFGDRIRFPSATTPGTELPTDDEAVLNYGQIKKIMSGGTTVVQTVVGSGGGGGGGGVESTNVTLDGGTVTY